MLIFNKLLNPILLSASPVVNKIAPYLCSCHFDYFPLLICINHVILYCIVLLIFLIYVHSFHDYTLMYYQIFSYKYIRINYILGLIILNVIKYVYTSTVPGLLACQFYLFYVKQKMSHQILIAGATSLVSDKMSSKMRNKSLGHLKFFFIKYLNIPDRGILLSK